MKVAEIIAEVIQAGAQIRAVSGGLQLNAPQPLIPELIERVRVHKLEILLTLESMDDATVEATLERAAILEYDAGLPRISADKVARLAGDFHQHIFGVGKHTGCCHPPVERYCAEGKRLRDVYFAAGPDPA